MSFGTDLGRNPPWAVPVAFQIGKTCGTAQEHEPLNTTRTDAVLDLSVVTKTHQVGEVEVHALRGVDFALDGGEFMVLLGPSGSGKSTLLDILGALDVPTEGRVRYRDQGVTDADVGQLTEKGRRLLAPEVAGAGLRGARQAAAHCRPG